MFSAMPRRGYAFWPVSTILCDMERLQGMMAGRSNWRLAVGVLCVLLVFFAGMVAATHQHESGNLSHADCGLCATAHTSVQLTPDFRVEPVLQVAARVEARIPVARPRTLARFALFIRPPPSIEHHSL